MAIKKQKYTAAMAKENEKKFKPIFDAAERQYNIPTGMLLAMGRKESTFNPVALNTYSGASGIMQLRRPAHPSLKNPFNPNEAIFYAAKYLADMYRRFGSWPMALAAYNWGPTNVRKFEAGEKKSMPTETRNYISTIMTWFSADPRNQTRMIAYL